MGGRMMWRRAGGKFAKTPSLESLGVALVCRACGQINVRDNEGALPDRCSACKQELRPKVSGGAA